MTPRSTPATPDPEKPRGSAEPIPGRCGAKLRGTNPARYCMLYPKPGGTRCTRFHGSKAPQVKAAAEQRVAVEAAVAEGERLARLGGQRVIDPLDALLGQVYEAAFNVEAYRLAIGDLVVDVGAWSDSDTVALPERIVEFERGGTHVPARVHVLVDLYNQERDRLVKYSKLCLDARVDERRVRVAEADAQRFAAALGGALDDVGEQMSDELRATLRTALGRRLRALSAGAA